MASWEAQPAWRGSPISETAKTPEQKIRECNSDPATTAAPSASTGSYTARWSGERESQVASKLANQKARVAGAQILCDFALIDSASPCAPSSRLQPAPMTAATTCLVPEQPPEA